jgi:hypothetical protein
MIKEDPSTVYHINAQEEEAIAIDNLQPFVITEGLGESSGSIGIMPLSNFMWMSVTTCVLFGIISMFFWAYFYPRGEWMTPVGFTLFTLAYSTYTIFKVWEALYSDD